MACLQAEECIRLYHCPLVNGSEKEKLLNQVVIFVLFGHIIFS